MDHETDRLADLEARYAFQEKAIAELGGLVYEQGRRLDRLEDLVRQLAERLTEFQPDGGSAWKGGRKRPPHY